MQHRKPYIGATVHYRFREHDTPMAAIITHVHDDQWVSLFLIPAWRHDARLLACRAWTRAGLVLDT